jgi:hypothetical protein
MRSNTEKDKKVMPNLNPFNLIKYYAKLLVFGLDNKHNHTD